MDSMINLIDGQISKAFDKEALENISKFLKITAEIILIIDETKFDLLMGYLNIELKNNIEEHILSILSRSHKKLVSVEKIMWIMNYIIPLIEFCLKQKVEDYKYEIIQTDLAIITHMIELPNPKDQLKVIINLKKLFVKPTAILTKVTIPAMIWELYKLITKDKENLSNIMEVVNSLIETLSTIDLLYSIKISLHGILVLNSLNIKDDNIRKFGVEFMDKSLIQYESTISEKKYNVLISIIGTLQNAKIYSNETRIKYIKKIIELSAGLYNEPNQCKALLACAQLVKTELQVWYYIYIGI